MKQILSNIALFSLTNFCKEKGIDCSGSHLYKYPRKFTYALLDDSTGKAIVSVTFNESAMPTYTYIKITDNK